MKLKKWAEVNQLVKNNNNVISFIDGSPDIDICRYYYKFIRKIIIKLLKSEKESVFRYSLPQGNQNLREEISIMLKNDGSFFDSSFNILVTNGGQQGLKLLIDSLLNPGDYVVMKSPIYIGIEKPLKDRGIKILEFNEKNIIKYRPKLAYLIPDFNNPTGISISLKERKKIILMAKKYNFLIIEDQTYRQLYFDIKKQIKSISSLYKKTIVVSSISKFIVPGLRVGWISMNNRKLINKLICLKESSDLSTSNLDQQIVFNILKKINNDPKILNKVRNYYEYKMNNLVDSLNFELKDYFTWVKPVGGYYIWLESIKKINIGNYFSKCVKNNVSFSPGFLFSLSNKNNYSLRLSISNIKKTDIKNGVNRLKKSLFC